MLHYPHINPIAFQIGPLKVHWYGLMYLLGFISAWLLGLWRIKHHPSYRDWTADQVVDLIFYAALGVIIGGRVGYVLLYDFDNFVQQPLMLFKVWEGGMSFHGGLLGVTLAMLLFSWRTRRNLFDITDFIAPLVPIGLAAGRLGNFINDELWGRVTSVPWGMVFPNAGPLPRHPSQLYEFLLEGVALFVLLWCFAKKPRPRFAVSALFLFGYGVFRFFVEFFREPDPQRGFLAWGWLTEGQLLSAPMIIVGGFALVYIYWRQFSQASNKG